MDKEFLRRLGQRVRSLRKRAGLTIVQLAETAGVDAGFLTYIELGRKAPSLVTLAKLSRGLAVPPATLFDDAAPLPAGAGELVVAQARSLAAAWPAKDQPVLVSILRKLRDRRKAGAILELLGK